MSSRVYNGWQLFPLLGHDCANHSECNRLASFMSWPQGLHVSTLSLASAGFLYTGREDEVRCHFCRFTKRHWRAGDKPGEVHRQGAPNCPLYREDNPPRGPSNLPIPLFRVRNSGGVRLADSLSTPQGLAQPESSSGAEPPVDLVQERMRRDLGVQFRRGGRENDDSGMYGHYSSKKKRIASFEGSAFSSGVVLKMAHYGFFYAGTKDLVICFHCGLMLHQWQNPDEPAIEHARESPSCAFLLDVMRPAMVAMVQNELNVIGHAQ